MKKDGDNLLFCDGELAVNNNDTEASFAFPFGLFHICQQHEAFCLKHHVFWYVVVNDRSTQKWFPSHDDSLIQYVICLM